PRLLSRCTRRARTTCSSRGCTRRRRWPRSSRARWRKASTRCETSTSRGCAGAMRCWGRLASPRSLSVSAPPSHAAGPCRPPRSLGDARFAPWLAHARLPRLLELPDASHGLAELLRIGLPEACELRRVEVLDRRFDGGHGGDEPGIGCRRFRGLAQPGENRF